MNFGSSAGTPGGRTVAPGGHFGYGRTLEEPHDPPHVAIGSMVETRKDAMGPMSTTAQIRGGAALAVSVAALGLAVPVHAAPPEPGRQPLAASAQAHPAVSHGRDAATARARRALLRSLRRDPRAALRAGFLHKAWLLDVKLPLTARLRDGATISVAPGTTRWPLDPAVAVAPAAPQTASLSGKFELSLDFGAGAGYGGIGNVQARAGAAVALTIAALHLAEFPACAAPPAAGPVPLAATSPIAVSSAGTTWTDLNPFTGAADGTLDLNLTLSDRVAAGCADAAPATYSDAAPRLFTLSWLGRFRVSPAITEDGQIRLGTLAIDDASQPQPLSAGALWACAPVSAVLPPPVAPVPCKDSLGQDAAALTAEAFPERVKVVSATADLLLGTLASLGP